MRKTYLSVRIIALMLLMVTLLYVTVYAQEEKVVNPKVNGLQNVITVNHEEDTISLTGIVLDVSGTLWYMPDGIPLTFLSDEDESMIFKYKLYTETDAVLRDKRENHEIIWDYWYYKTGNAKGVAGLMGNIKTESGFIPNNLQGVYEKRLGMNDITYTAAVDRGTYRNFARDGAGYGLVQCTHWALKERLLNFARARNASIGDIYLQCDFIYNEFMVIYPDCGKNIMYAQTVNQASNYILLNFERPADQSVSAQNRRAGVGKDVYNQCVSRCANVDAMKLDIQQQIETAIEKVASLNMNYNLQSQWSNFLTDFYTYTPVMPEDILDNAWNEIMIS